MHRKFNGIEKNSNLFGKRSNKDEEKEEIHPTDLEIVHLVLLLSSIQWNSSERLFQVLRSYLDSLGPAELLVINILVLDSEFLQGLRREKGPYLSHNRALNSGHNYCVPFF